MNIKSVKWIDKNVIEVIVQYGGGCKRHIITYDIYTEQNVVIVNMKHEQPDGRDICRALISQSIEVIIPERYKNLRVEVRSKNQSYIL